MMRARLKWFSFAAVLVFSGCVRSDERPAEPAQDAEPPGADVVLGEVQKDLTGDSVPETLRLVGVGATLDRLDATLTIASGGKVLYEVKLSPLTRTVGFDASKRTLSMNEHLERLSIFGLQFLDDTRFKSPAAFVADLSRSGPTHVDAIPSVIMREGGFGADSLRARGIWNEMQKSAVQIFEYSPGGDRFNAIGWSAAEGRFYNLIECC
jgi:hypothetical protein